MTEMWMVSTGGTFITVEAENQWQAFDDLRNEPPEAFGLIVQAHRAKDDGDEDQTYGVRTSMLFWRWGRFDDAMALTAYLVLFGGLSLDDARTLPEWDEALWQGCRRH